MPEFKPMLASAIEDVATLKFPLLASPKLDGIRCVVRGGKALSRSLKPIPNRYVRDVLEALEWTEGFDGELMAGNNFQDVGSAIMSHDGKPKFIYNVFDITTRNDSEPFSKRFEYVEQVCKDADFPMIKIVPHEWVTDLAALNELEERYLAEGYEGVMLRDHGGPYKHGRSTVREGWLLKLKRFVDDEAEIIGFEERMHNANEAFKSELGRTKRSTAQEGMVPMGVLGAFVCKTKDGVQFNVGSGLTDAQRAEWWAKKEALVGKLVKFKYQPVGVKVAPRSPIFLGLRSELDL